MDEERDLVVFEDDAGNELTMEVLDYLAYEGKEYALLTEYVEDADEDDSDEIEVMVMEVRPVHPSKADHRISITEAGISREVSAEQSAKALVQIWRRVWGRVISDRDVQPENAP